ncbi:MAG TPA: sulfur carrier protein ThiS adenylyltransferase ThiF [Ruminococcus sp.]|nr:sulfur carrier protein ThiS adenylyltransferase ThiF [Ruminococcus sp.]
MIPSREEMYRALEERHGKELQKKLSEAAVAVCGLGGLGSNIAVSLARAGVGELLLIDFDTVDISNLNRQQYFPEQLGLPKTEALSETLRKIAPYCNIRSAQVKLNEENAPELLADVPFICEAFDRADQKEMLVGCILEKMPEKYLVAASGMAGIGSANTIRTRRITDRLYICGDGESDSAAGLGLVSARVMVCAAHQANMIIRLIAGEFTA